MQSYFFLLLIGGGLKCMTQILMLPKDMWPRGLMDKASVFGTEDCRFESYRGQRFPQDFVFSPPFCEPCCYANANGVP